MAGFGYDDTPVIPGQKWRVHDGTRPQPVVVSPGTESSQDAPGAPPSDAIVLFDGSTLDGWVSKNDRSKPAPWKLENGYMEVIPRSGNIETASTFGSCQLHLEYAAPAEIKGEGQGRGNSGIFLMSQYEIQVLDNYENPTYADGVVGAIYGQCPPLANSMRKPGEWNTVDIIWVAPEFAGDQLVSPACVTVLFNGVLQHHAKTLQGPTKHKQTTQYVPHPPTMPLCLQDHGDLVRFRNIWYRPLHGYNAG
jgi:hypothetical protein